MVLIELHIASAWAHLDLSASVSLLSDSFLTGNAYLVLLSSNYINAPLCQSVGSVRPQAGI